MKQKYLILIVLYLLSTSCNAEKRREEAINYLKSKRFELGGDGIIINNVVVSNATVTKTDIEKICDIGTVKSIFLQSSHIEKGAIRGLEKCDKLQAITYEPLQITDKKKHILTYGEPTTLPYEDIPDHDKIPHLFKEKEASGLYFSGSGYGDDIMPYLAKLKRIREIAITGINETKSGPITDEGIRLFVESRESTGQISLDLRYQSKITDKSFEYLLNLKGLKRIAFGPKTVIEINVTEEAARKFRKAYHEKYGYYPEVFVDYH